MLIILKSQENLSRLSHSATTTKQINAIQEGVALTMKSWVKACGVSKNILKPALSLKDYIYCKRL